MKTSESINEIAVALSAAQAEMPILKKENTVSMELKSGRIVEYDYLELGSIVDQSKSVLSKNGLSIIQPRSTIDGKPALFTLLMHKSGQFIQTYTILELAGKSEQEKGSAITYNSRYDYVGMLRLGLIGEDDDGITASNNKNVTNNSVASPLKPESLSDYVIKTKGQLTGKKLSELSLSAIQSNAKYWSDRAAKENKQLTGAVKLDVEASLQYLKEQEK